MCRSSRSGHSLACIRCEARRPRCNPVDRGSAAVKRQILVQVPYVPAARRIPATIPAVSARWPRSLRDHPEQHAAPPLEELQHRHPGEKLATSRWFRLVKSPPGTFGLIVERLVPLEHIYQCCQVLLLSECGLRHTWASWAVQSGVTLHELMLLGGWRSFSMEMRCARFAPDHLAAAAAKIRLKFRT
jgi:hypothetical protein